MVDVQRRVFADAFNRIYREGNWCVAIDEMWYFANQLKLDGAIKLYLTQGRSLGISLVTATQRPVSVPVEVYDQSTHLFFWRDNDRRNLDRLSEINSRVSSSMIRDLVGNLDRYQVLYLNTREGTMYRTRAPHPTEATK
jgi:DNA helicase HerA-like ATPase